MALSVLQATPQGTFDTENVKSCTFSGATTTGSLIVVAISIYDDFISDIVSVTDSKGNTYQQAVAAESDAQQSLIYYSFDVNGGASHSVTVTWSDDVWGFVSAIEVAGAAVLDVLDAVNTNVTNLANGNTSQAISTPSTLSQVDEIVVAVTSFEETNTGDVNIVAPSGFTEFGVLQDFTPINAGEAAYKIVEAKDQVTATWTMDSLATGGARAAAIATFKAAPFATYRSHAESAAGGTSYTFNGLSIGPASADRRVYVHVGWRHTADATVTGVTIGGTPMESVDSNKGASGGSRCGVHVWQLDVPSGTTGNFVVSISGSQRVQIHVYSTHFRMKSTPFAVAKDDNPGGGFASPQQLDLNVNISENGFAIGNAVCAQTGSSPDWAWTGLVERDDVANNINQGSSASIANPYGVTPLSITAIISAAGGGTPIFAPTGIVVSFEPEATNVFAAAGASTAAFVGNTLASGVFSSAGVATVDWRNEGVFSGAGVATASFVGSMLRDGVWSGAGIGAGLFIGIHHEGIFSAAAAASIAWSSLIAEDGVLSLNGEAAVSWVGLLTTRWVPEDPVSKTWVAESGVL